MTTKAVAGALLIVAPIWFNVWFAVLASRFDYPDILRRPTDESSRIFLCPRLSSRREPIVSKGVVRVAGGGVGRSGARDGPA